MGKKGKQKQVLKSWTLFRGILRWFSTRIWNFQINRCTVIYWSYKDCL